MDDQDGGTAKVTVAIATALDPGPCVNVHGYLIYKSTTFIHDIRVVVV